MGVLHVAPSEVTVTAIRCIDLVKTYEGRPPVEAVRGLNLSVNAGECFGLLGPNGAGKTTTMEILEGLLQATSGAVEVLGRRWTQATREIKQRIGITFQDTQFQEKLTVFETLTLFRSFYDSGIAPEEALAKVELQEKANARVGKLSGGQKQRLAIACALVGDPELLFLDEPTTGLDPQSRRQVWEIIGHYRQRGHTVLLTTHYMDEAQRLCDRIAIIDHGKVIALGTPAELIASLGGEHVVELSLDVDTLPETIAENLESLPAVRFSQIRDDQIMLSVEHLHVAIPAVLDWARDRRHSLRNLTTHQATLEDVFVKLAGRKLSESETQ